MTRSFLQPIRTRRFVHSVSIQPRLAIEKPLATPAVRKTLPAVTARWISSALSSSVRPSRAAHPEALAPHGTQFFAK
jgi:hypothetical protein